MADTKISQLTSGGAVQSTDAIPAVRAGANVRVTVGTAAPLNVAASGNAESGEVVKGDDTRLTDSREWTAGTVDQAEAEAGTATTRRAWTAQRVAQAIAAQVAAWWTALTVGPSKITMSTARLIGRTTAGSGAAEEISVGSGLSLSGGTLSATGGGGGAPGGSGGQFQYNNAGAFGGSAALTLDGSTLATTGNIRFSSTGGLNLFVYDATAIISGRYQTTERNRISLLQGSGHDIKINAAYGGSSGAVMELGVGGSTGYVEINNGTAGASNRRDLYARRVLATEGVQLTAATVGTLPSAASNTYLSAVVTDASAPTVGATVASGGSAKAVVRSNGTNYIVTEVL